MTTWVWLALAGLVCGFPALNRAERRLRALPGFGRPEVKAPAFPRAPRVILMAVLTRRRARRVVVSVVAGVSGGLAAGLCGQVLVGVSAALAAGLILAATFSSLARRSVAGARRDLRSALSLLDAELSAGARENDALLAASHVGGASSAVLRAAADVTGRGGDVAAVFAAGPSGLSGMAAAWTVRSLCGAPLAEIVAKVEADLATGDAYRREVDAALAGPRSSAVMLSVLPVLGVLLGAAMGAHPLPFLLGTDAGSVLLLAGVLADAAGLLWMQQLIRTGAPT